MSDEAVQTTNGRGALPSPSGALLASDVARVLSNPTLSPPFLAARTPRLILMFLEEHANVPVRGGTYRVNRVTEEGIRVLVQSNMHLIDLPAENLRVRHSHPEGDVLAASAALYESPAKEVDLQIIQAIVKIHTRVPALFSDTHDQLQFQIGLAAEYMEETKENLVFNHPDYGLLNNVNPRMTIRVDGPPSPDVLDALLARAWKRPDLFVMHPEALEQFRIEANARSLTLDEATLYGSSFTTWRGLPIAPTNKLHLVAKTETPTDQTAETEGDEAFVLGNRVDGECTTNVLLMRLGLEKQGVISLYEAGTKGTPRLPYISVDYMGLSDDAVASYLLTTYAGMVVATPGALARAEVTV